MSPLFGSKNEDQADSAAVQAEVDRLSSLPLPQLAAEVMTKGFGPDGPADDGLPSIRMIVDAFVPDLGRLDDDAHQRMNEVVSEGVQVLEHASLVRATVWGGEGGLYYTATRLGRAALENNAVDRAIAGGSL
jgi:hypothetical protein